MAFLSFLVGAFLFEGVLSNHLPMSQCPYYEGNEEWVGIGTVCGVKGGVSFSCKDGYCGDNGLCEALKGLLAPCEGLGQHKWCAGDDLKGPHFCKNSVSAGGFACQLKYPTGQGCINDVECQSGLCDTNQVCVGVMSKALDEICGHQDECKKNLVCAKSTKLQGGNTVNRCLTPAKLGAPCAVDEDLACESGYCAGSVCSEKLANDALCTRNSMCQSDFCFTLSPEIPMRCTPKLEDYQPCDAITAVGCESKHCVQVPGICSILTLNEVCDLTWGSRGGCDEGLSCFLTTGTEKYMCTAQAMIGETCGTGGAPCDDSSYCSSTTNKCVRYLADGETCTQNGLLNNDICASKYCAQNGVCSARKKAGTACTYSMMGDDLCEKGTYCPNMPEATCTKLLSHGAVCDYEKYVGRDCDMGLFCDVKGSGRCIDVMVDEEPCFSHAACGWDKHCSMFTADVNECIQCSPVASFLYKSSSATLSFSPLVSIGLMAAVVLMSVLVIQDRSGYADI